MKNKSGQQVKKDRVYAQQRSRIGKFVFDEGVANVFPDMIRRSVPGYEAALSMTEMLAARFAMPGSRCYDLGCSLGASTRALARGTAGKGCEVVGIDNAPAMIDACRLNMAKAGLADVQLHCQDIRETTIHNASVVVLNYTLQFITPDHRLSLLQDIFTGLLPGGVVILSEKVIAADEREQELMTSLHLDFKRAHGYSELEISQKRTALENVLIPDTIDAHKERLMHAGFATTSVWFRCLNFVSLLAVKQQTG